MRVALLFNFGVGFCFQCCQCFSEQHQKHWIFLLSATHDLTRCTLSTSTPFSHLFFVILSQINILWRCVFVSVTLLHYMLPSSVSFFNLCIDCKPLFLLKKNVLAMLCFSLSLSDWPSPAPNPSLTMQLWVSRRSPLRICCLSATSLNNIPAIAARRTAPQKLDKKHTLQYPGWQKQHALLNQKEKNISPSPVHKLNEKACIWYSVTAAEKPEWIPWYHEMLFLWMPACQNPLLSV